MNSKLYIVIGVIVLAAAGYFLLKNMSGYSQTAMTNTAVSPSPEAMAPSGYGTSPAASDATISVASDPKFGQILVGNNGMTLYAYTKDSPDTVTCAGACLTNWPPLLTQGSPAAGTGITQAMLGSAAMADGSKIVTYNHMPLYYFAKDAKAGDVTGQGVGGVWYAVSPDGKIVTN